MSNDPQSFFSCIHSALQLGKTMQGLLYLVTAEGSQDASLKKAYRKVNGKMLTLERNREITQSNLFILQVGKLAQSCVEGKVALTFGFRITEFIPGQKKNTQMLLSVQILQDGKRLTLKSLLDLSLKYMSTNLNQLCDFSHILQIYKLMSREVK